MCNDASHVTLPTSNVQTDNRALLTRLELDSQLRNADTFDKAQYAAALVEGVFYLTGFSVREACAITGVSRKNLEEALEVNEAARKKRVDRLAKLEAELAQARAELAQGN